MKTATRWSVYASAVYAGLLLGGVWLGPDAGVVSSVRGRAPGEAATRRPVVVEAQPLRPPAGVGQK